MKNIKNGLVALLVFVSIGIILSLFERSLWQILLAPGIIFSNLFSFLFLENESVFTKDWFQNSFLLAEFISVFFYFFVGIFLGWVYGEIKKRKI